MRKFEGIRGIRDTGNGKYEYLGFRHPLGEHSFAKYMHKHRQMPDGSMRGSNNWWDVWETEVSIQSLNRHLEDLNAIHSGFRVFKERFLDDEGEAHEYTHILKPQDEPHPEWKDVTEVTKEDCLNAIRFNAEAYKLKILL